MSEETIKIPKFRKTGRIADWMEKNDYEERMPKEIEDLFFNSKEEPHIVLSSLIKYHHKIGLESVPQELEDLLYEKAKASIPNLESSNSIVWDFRSFVFDFRGYSNHNAEGFNVQRLVDLLKGKSEHLLQWAIWTDQRLPTHLEDSLDDPDCLLQYSKEVLKGRLPSHLEDVFHKDVHAATEYAFDVIRGFAPVKLPDALHNFVIMESFKTPNDQSIKNYMKASESDPNKIGNWSDA